MKFIRTEAIILRRTNYGEADRILNVLTPEHGKVAAIAKGVRRPKSKLAGGLELFAVCDITLGESRSDLFLVTSARLQSFFGSILHDYDRMQFGYQAIKQIAQATETVSEPEFFFLLKNTLTYLNDASIDWRLNELWFQLQLAHLLGEGINLQTDKEGNVLKESLRYGFSTVEGTFFALPGGEFGSDHIKMLRLALQTTPAVLSRISSPTLNPARDLRVFLRHPGNQ